MIVMRWDVQLNWGSKPWGDLVLFTFASFIFGGGEQIKPHSDLSGDQAQNPLNESP
jgi:hypothetical protein